MSSALLRASDRPLRQPDRGPLLALSLPPVGTQLLQVAYNLVDTFVVGRLGDGAVAALTYLIQGESSGL